MKRILAVFAAVFTLSACAGDGDAQAFAAMWDDLERNPVGVTSRLRNAVAIGGVIMDGQGGVASTAPVTNDQFHDHLETMLSSRRMLASGSPRYKVYFTVRSVEHPRRASNSSAFAATVDYVVLSYPDDALVFKTTVEEECALGADVSRDVAVRDAASVSTAMTMNIVTFTDRLASVFPEPAPGIQARLHVDI